MSPRLLFIIDDDPIFRMVTRRLVANLCIPALTIVECENGEIGLQKLEELRNPDIEVTIFLDINMPVLNGWGFLDAVEHASYNKEQMEVFVTSSSVDEVDVTKARCYDLVRDFVHKPLPMTTLRSLLCARFNS